VKERLILRSSSRSTHHFIYVNSIYLEGSGNIFIFSANEYLVSVSSSAYCEHLMLVLIKLLLFGFLLPFPFFTFFYVFICFCLSFSAPAGFISSLPHLA
jgi:hypothetical protein